MNVHLYEHPLSCNYHLIEHFTGGCKFQVYSKFTRSKQLCSQNLPFIQHQCKGVRSSQSESLKLINSYFPDDNISSSKSESPTAQTSCNSDHFASWPILRRIAQSILRDIFRNSAFFLKYNINSRKNDWSVILFGWPVLILTTDSRLYHLSLQKYA